MDLAVGCPVAHRGWVLDHWFDHVEEACSRAEVTPRFVFVGDPDHDDSFEVIGRRASNVAIAVAPTIKSDDRRDWGLPARYEQMVGFRNLLLQLVRGVDAPAFLSIDSDILIHPDAIATLLADLHWGWDAVGGKCYLSETGTSCPSWGRFGREGSIQRMEATGLFQVEILMAIKMMAPTAFNVDYQFHLQGEDVGWSKACAEAGLKFAWDGTIASKHIFKRHMLDRIDPRVGF